MKKFTLALFLVSLAQAPAIAAPRPHTPASTMMTECVGVPWLSFFWGPWVGWEPCQSSQALPFG